MKQITEDMLTQFNEQVLKIHPIELVMEDGPAAGCVKIQLKHNPFIESSIINPSEYFYGLLNNYFEQVYGIKLNFNNTGTVFWSKGWLNDNLGTSIKQKK